MRKHTSEAGLGFLNLLRTGELLGCKSVGGFSPCDWREVDTAVGWYSEIGGDISEDTKLVTRLSAL